MGTSISVFVSTDEIQYSFELNRKITIITGYSGTGKSSLYRIIMNKKNSASYEERVSDPRYRLTPVPEGDCYTAIRGSILTSKEDDTRHIFILDDEEFVTTKEFARLFKSDMWNLYIIVDRFQGIKETSLSTIPYSIQSVYNLISNGRNHWLEPKYCLEKTDDEGFDCVITEGQSFGYKFLLNYNKNISTSKGKDNIVKLLNSNKDILSGKSVLLFLDMASYGASFSSLMSLAVRTEIDISIVEDYECFEYLMMNSYFLSKDSEVKSAIESSKEISTLVRYQSHEKMYEDLIHKATIGKKV